MKVLITVEFYYAPGGGGIAEQARQIAEGLVRHGHEVLIATSPVAGRAEMINGVTIKSFAISGNRVKGISGDIEGYRTFLKNSSVDVLLNFAANVWTTDIALEIAKELPMKKVLSTPGLSKLGTPAYDEYYKNFYAKQLLNYDKIIYTSLVYKDKKFGDEHGLQSKAVIIANGASEEEFLGEQAVDFRKEYNITTPRLVISVANHYLAKGHAFVLKAWKKMKRSDATLVIIGQRPARHSWYSCYPFCKYAELVGKNIRVLSLPSRELTLSAYKQADLFLFGSKIECAPLVMYESMAARVPFVTTNVGNVADHAGYVTIIDSPEAMANVANKLLDNEAERKRMADKAHELWKHHYTWSQISKEYEKILSSETCNSENGICRK